MLVPERLVGEADAAMLAGEESLAFGHVSEVEVGLEAVHRAEGLIAVAAGHRALEVAAGSPPLGNPPQGPVALGLVVEHGPLGCEDPPALAALVDGGATWRGGSCRLFFFGFAFVW